MLTNSVFGFIQAYVLLATAVSAFGRSDFGERIRRGTVATDLIRPVHPLRAGLAFDYGRALYHTICVVHIAIGAV